MTGPLLSAALLSLAFPPLAVPLLPFVALVPFATAVGGAPASRPRDAALAGGVLGAVHFVLILHWMPVALARHDVATLPLFGVVVGCLALLMTAAGWTLHHLRHRGGVPLALALPLVWGGAEWLRSDVAGPLAFPWLTLGTSLAGVPGWAGIAEWVGVGGVGCWLAAVNGLAADAWLARDAGRRRWASALAGAVVLAAVPVAWGIHRAATLPLRPAGVALLVQTGLPVGLDPDERMARTARVLAELDVGPGATVVVLPEMTIPVFPGEARALPLLVEVVDLARRARAPVLFGAPGRGIDEDDRERATNSVMVAAGGRVMPIRFDKRALVPGVEATSAWGLGWPGTPPRGYMAGREYGVLRVGTTFWGPLICVESAFGDIARRLRSAGAEVLVNVTNDGWLAGTGGMAQHPAHLVMRAVETRTGAVRAATTGRTLVVDPTGRVRALGGTHGAATLRAEVLTTDVVTGFVHWGDVAGPVAGFGTLILLLFGEVWDRRRRWARDGVPVRYRRWWWGVGSRHGSRKGG